MNKDYILATRIRARDAICEHFAQRLVDVAYADYGSDDTKDSVRIDVESSTDLRDTIDIAWILGILHSTLIELNEPDAQLEIVLCD
jgi:hypothetical protein